MCGICGFNYQDKKVIKTMSDEIKHRGPDGDGFHIDENASLAHRRLSIIDLDTRGMNPIYNEDKSVCIFFNGEIYNYRELRPDLEKKKHKFRTQTDTEVILHGYEEYGYDYLQKLNGMFAFCIYDKKKDLLFLARDRFGIKPLYYYFSKGTFVFASEIKALLKNPKVTVEADDNIIANYLQNNLIPEDKEETFFKGIKKLMPGHYAVVHKKTLKIQKYYELKNVEKSVSKKIDEKESIKKYRELFSDSIRLHLISDVPVGACLSGGLDSSSIVAAIDEIVTKKVREGESVHGKVNCFSAVYDDKASDEREYITEAVKGKKAISHYTFPESKGFWKNLEKVIYHQDEPTETIAVYAQYCVMEKAEKKVKVLLDGQGADESLGGYIPYYRHFLMDLLKTGNIVQLGKETLYGFQYIKDMFATYLRLGKSQNDAQFFFNIPPTPAIRYVNSSFMSLTDRQLYDISHNLPKVLKYEDRNSMAFGIESRIPFLDYRLVEFSFSLPETMKIRNGWTKYILRHAMKDILAPKIALRKTKLGFPVPDYKWLVDNKNNILELFNSPEFKERKYFHAEAISQAFKEMCYNPEKKYLTSYFWRIINLELWFRIFFKQTK